MNNEVCEKTSLKDWLSSLPFSCAVFTLAMALAFPLYGWVGSSYFASRGLYGAVIAGLVCWIAGIVALMITGVSARLGSHAALNGILVSMLIRMGLPMATAILLSSQPAFADTGIFGLIVGYYLFALVVETPLSVVLNSTAHPVETKSSSKTDSVNNKLTGAS